MDPAARSRLMSMIKSQGTGPEMILRRALWHAGLRYRVQYGKERVDIAFPGKGLAIFVDGCFWHSCPEHGEKLRRNSCRWRNNAYFVPFI